MGSKKYEDVNKQAKKSEERVDKNLWAFAASIPSLNHFEKDALSRILEEVIKWQMAMESKHFWKLECQRSFAYKIEDGLRVFAS